MNGFKVGDLVRQTGLWDKSLNITGIVITIIKNPDNSQIMLECYMGNNKKDWFPDWMMEVVE